ncbi:JAB domain-containing protein [Sphingomonas sp.]|uniref:JAB domain-containing protein n=1 Tax=Sphingomonas sp. TaxID=28214 RepID=UPI0031D3D1EA
MPPLPALSRRIRTRDDARTLFAALATRPIEAVALAFLCPKRRLLGLRHVLGHTDSVPVPVARVARDAILFGAGAVLMAHNHPDGNPHPSAADLALTRRMAQGLAALDIALLDHLIFGGDMVVSLRDEGLL